MKIFAIFLYNMLLYLTKNAIINIQAVDLDVASVQEHNRARACQYPESRLRIRAAKEGRLLVISSGGYYHIVLYHSTLCFVIRAHYVILLVVHYVSHRVCVT